MIRIKSEDEIKRIAAACAIVSDVFAILALHVVDGMVTGELDMLAVSVMQKHRARSAFKGYRGYPANICISVDNEVVHGIPGKRKLHNGDLVSIDVGVAKDGYFGDATRSYAVGQVSAIKRKLMQVTDEALLLGVAQAVAGNRVMDISRAVQTHVENNGFTVVRDLVGHGVGSQLHEEPQIPNFAFSGPNPALKPGMTLAIEPMVNEGGYQVKILSDDWTVVTSDGLASAHYEDTVVVGEYGPRNLTRVN
jgi:methionyl aminopeptidase